MSTIIFAGLDLGQVSDPSAFVVLERDMIPDPDPLSVKRGLVGCYGGIHVHRWHLGTSYPEIVRSLQRTYSLTPRLHQSTLVVDATGVGRPVCDMIAEANLPCRVRPYSITAGRNPNENPEEGYPTVPKLLLVNTVQAVLQSRRIFMAEGLELGPLLMKELKSFKVKVDDLTRNETFGSFRDGDNDDTVLALALALWYAEEHGRDHGPPVLPGPDEKPLLPGYLGGIR